MWKNLHAQESVEINYSTARKGNNLVPVKNITAFTDKEFL